ncbi:10721_t:CDS:2, partial [Funneliformis geosporum]
ISQTIKCHVRLKINIADREDIQKAIQNIAEAQILQLTSECEFGHILACALPHINE